MRWFAQWFDPEEDQEGPFARDNMQQGSEALSNSPPRIHLAHAIHAHGSTPHNCHASIPSHVNTKHHALYTHTGDRINKPTIARTRMLTKSNTASFFFASDHSPCPFTSIAATCRNVPAPSAVQIPAPVDPPKFARITIPRPAPNGVSKENIPINKKYCSLCRVPRRIVMGVKARATMGR